MGDLVSRIPGTRGLVVAAIVIRTVGLIAAGNPLEHPQEGEDSSGQRGISGIPRIVLFAGLAIAFVLAWPPDRSGGRDRGE